MRFGPARTVRAHPDRDLLSDGLLPAFDFFLEVAVAFLHLPGGVLNPAFVFQALVAEDPACDLLYFALRLLDVAFDLIVIHEVFLECGVGCD
jgi:hypothetical protein